MKCMGCHVFLAKPGPTVSISPRPSRVTTSPRNVEFVRNLGADVIIDYMQQALREVVKDVDVVLDTIGGDVLRDSFRGVKRGGSIVSLPAHKGVKALGEHLAPKSGVAFALIAVHPSGEQLPRFRPKQPGTDSRG